jgi:hypothetical protein
MVWPTVARAVLKRPPAGRVADAALVAALRERLAAAAQARLGRSLAIRHVAAGSCNACELELRATQSTTSPNTASPSPPARAMRMCC